MFSKSSNGEIKICFNQLYSKAKLIVTFNGNMEMAREAEEVLTSHFLNAQSTSAQRRLLEEELNPDQNL